MSSKEREKWHRHMGVYGICLNTKQELLVIKKNGGPYTGFYDLPGGSMEESESLQEALIREMVEETGYNVKIEKCLGCFDFLINSEYNGCPFTQHIGVFYIVSLADRVSEKIERIIINQTAFDENDSLGVEWIKLSDINLMNSSPLVEKTKKLLNGIVKFGLEEYTDWVR